MPAVTVELKYPVTVAGEDIRSLTMRSPKVRDVMASEKAVKGAGFDKSVVLSALMCNVAPAVIEELEMVDFQRLQVEAENFLL